MIQITLQFNTIDEAIVFLSKQHPVAKVRNAAAIEPIVGTAGRQPLGEGAVLGEVPIGAAPSAHAASAAVSTTNKQRKPRADAGKPRGPRGATNAEAPAAPVEADKAQPPGVVPPVASAPQTAAPVTQEEATDKGSTSAPDAAAPQASEKDAQEAIQKVFTQQGGPQLALDTLASFGVKRCRDLKPEQRGDFVAKCNEILAPKEKS